MGARREGREQALQILYGMESNPVSLPQAVRHFWEGTRGSAASQSFAEELVAGVVAHKAELDALIEEKSTNWTVPRMAKIDLNILRLAVFELRFRPDIPANVAINEAIEIAKKFGTEESPAFINGILDQIAGERTAERAADTVTCEET